MDPVLWIFLAVIVVGVLAIVVMYRRRASQGSMTPSEARIRGDKDFGGGGVE